MLHRVAHTALSLFRLFIHYSPQLDIHTVAAGGGSRLFLRSGLLVVGPESARAHPGPVCYRKDGYLAVTDANVVLGRVIPEYFPSIFGPNEDEPLDVEGARKAFDELIQQESFERTARRIGLRLFASGQ